jgi:hypothetical protein
VSDQINPDERFSLEETLLQRLRRRECQVPATRVSASPILRSAEALVELEEKVRAVTENGKRVGAKVDALVDLIGKRLLREGSGGATS